MGTDTSGALRHGLPLAELLAYAAVFWADSAGYIPLSKTPVLLLVASASLRLRRMRWRDTGLAWPAHGARLLALGAVAGIAFWAFEYFVENPVLWRLTGTYPDLTAFREVVGNLPLLGVYLLLNLLLAAIGEEMVWRGHALPRVAGVLGGSMRAWWLALLVVNAAFGLAHAYQGAPGMVQAAVQGVLLGALYIATGRNLVAPMAAHFMANNCDFLLIYLGRHVGLGH